MKTLATRKTVTIPFTDAEWRDLTEKAMQREGHRAYAESESEMRRGWLKSITNPFDGSRLIGSAAPVLMGMLGERACEKWHPAMGKMDTKLHGGDGGVDLWLWGRIPVQVKTRPMRLRCLLPMTEFLRPRHTLFVFCELAPAGAVRILGWQHSGTPYYKKEKSTKGHDNAIFSDRDLLPIVAILDHKPGEEAW